MKKEYRIKEVRGIFIVQEKIQRSKEGFFPWSKDVNEIFWIEISKEKKSFFDAKNTLNSIIYKRELEKKPVIYHYF